MYIVFIIKIRQSTDHLISITEIHILIKRHSCIILSIIHWRTRILQRAYRNLKSKATIYRWCRVFEFCTWLQFERLWKFNGTKTKICPNYLNVSSLAMVIILAVASNNVKENTNCIEECTGGSFKYRVNCPIKPLSKYILSFPHSFYWD